MGMWTVNSPSQTITYTTWLTPLSVRPNGVTFVAAVGTTQFAKRRKPQSGDIVSFKHHGYLIATKKPKLPTLYRMRPDLVWEDVVNSWNEQRPAAPGTPSTSTPSTNSHSCNKQDLRLKVEASERCQRAIGGMQKTEENILSITRWKRDSTP